MKPTLYAEDVLVMASQHLLSFPEPFDVTRILPRRCPNPQFYSRPQDCTTCDGLGFLYPDPPEWWMTERDLDDQLNPAERTWRWFCDDVWRVLGIVEVDE